MNSLHKLVAGMLLMAFAVVAVSEETVNEDINVLGIFDQIRLHETKTISATGIEPRTVLRTKLVDNQSPTSFLTSVSLAEPEEAESIQPLYKPVNLNPFADKGVFKSLRSVLNSSEDPRCDSTTSTGPMRSGDNVILNYEAVNCDTNNGEIGEWRLYLRLKSPGGALALKILQGEPYHQVRITFTTDQTEQSLGYQSGEWVARINLSVKRSTDWVNTLVAKERKVVNL